MLRSLADATAARHGVPADRVTPVPGGVANHAFALGDDLFLRIPRDAASATDLRKEAAVIPAARRTGVRTAGVVEFTESDPPRMLLERVPGAGLESVPLSGPRRAGVLRALGHDLALLHAAPPPAGLPYDDGGDPHGIVGHLARRGSVDPATAAWLTACFTRLDRLAPASPPCLLHGDVAPQNVLVGEAEEFAALVDWGDACRGEPAMEFAKLDLTDVVPALEGYGAPGLAPRILRHHLSWALVAAMRPPVTGQRHWTAPPLSRLLRVLRVLRFLASSPPEPWGSLARELRA
ncbi:aminoglycoside phosphotransferase family protein [Streptomyces sp. AV19]|uniref:phosphotransferase family protein n=1 Tax=Streptomyces sp. AV19 TaxID=2793068 RepID=UPI0018FEF7AC|nr:aminoglycoside phosphotransferase family protein [Streptomyces sp. AV19]MBH1938818.1 aminoglycoside phosphotransferase family protein [Streptomyces sp. AV19]MDG4534751.1 aminoglycoside phosphotransferase family protein [Streptomyces sp. AV19]